MASAVQSVSLAKQARLEDWMELDPMASDLLEIGITVRWPWVCAFLVCVGLTRFAVWLCVELTGPRSEAEKAAVRVSLEKMGAVTDDRI